MVILSIAELLNDKVTYSKYSAFAHELSMDFVSNTLKAVWDLLNKELPGQVTLADLRSPNLLRLKIRKILELRRKDGKIPKFKIRKIHFKFALIHEMFTMMDIFIFPNFVAAHKDGLKTAQNSNYDSSLWLTGGNDCLIKIHDIRAANAHVCLAQYVGHKSIITTAMFNSKETHIISSSFDRTLKVWLNVLISRFGILKMGLVSEP
jgi:WD40 repeat protein